ncbi:MAG: class I SAM-dependent methyltransferase, partial [Emcibacteraceae bacterium]|nr:class I SAM-dependent methyltransferase [Emcibacteraceae bacterium]
FDWNTYAYSTGYVSEKGNFGADFSTTFSIKLSNTAWELDRVSGEISFAAKPVLYPTHQLIITTAIKLKAASAFEFGYGSGPHIFNLRTALPLIRLGGADISEQMKGQAIASYSEHKHSKKHIDFLVRDLSDPKSCEDLRNTYELVYCHQVLLHIHRKGAAENFLKNMFAISSRYILLVENFNRHDLCRMINKLFPQNKVFLIDTKYATAVLIDKKNAVDMPIVNTDNDLRVIDKQTEDRFKRFLASF